MGLAELIIAMKKRRQQIQADSKPANPTPGTSIASVAKRTRPSCEQDDYSQGTKIMRYSGPELPEVLNTPIVTAKFLHLKLLEICLSAAEGAFSPAYDYLSLVFFLDACPVLETFKLSVWQTRMKHDPVSGDSSLLRKMPGHHHASIKNVKIDGFCSAKSMIELTCHILDNATSLENLKLDPIYDGGYEHVDRLTVHEIGDCSPHTGQRMIREAHKAVLAIEKYIVGKVPSNVKLNIKKPCSQCHSVK
ncbi:hypothetical protein ACQJBY_005159 [Aegilops geniculata]